MTVRTGVFQELSESIQQADRTAHFMMRQHGGRWTGSAATEFSQQIYPDFASKIVEAAQNTLRKMQKSELDRNQSARLFRLEESIHD